MTVIEIVVFNVLFANVWHKFTFISNVDTGGLPA